MDTTAVATDKAAVATDKTAVATDKAAVAMDTEAVPKDMVRYGRSGSHLTSPANQKVTKCKQILPRA